MLVFLRRQGILAFYWNIILLKYDRLAFTVIAQKVTVIARGDGGQSRSKQRFL